MPQREKNAARYLSVKYSYPLWIVKHFISLLGESECERLLDYFNTERYTDITVNTAKISVEKLTHKLKKQGVDAVASQRVPFSVRLLGSVDPRLLEGFDEGHFFVQDEACAIAVSLLDVGEGMSVLDACSAPGGKSLCAAILGGDRCKITASDIHESKLSLIEEGVRRLGLKSISVRERDASVAYPEECEKYDRVICDVPCSGLGVLGKKPDLRYRSKDALADLPSLQYDILNSVSGALKVGGILVYSTCTLNPSENEETVKRFLDGHSEFSPVDFSVADISSHSGTVTLLPHEHKTDGFFIAKLRKES